MHQVRQIKIGPDVNISTDNSIVVKAMVGEVPILNAIQYTEVILNIIPHTNPILIAYLYSFKLINNGKIGINEINDKNPIPKGCWEMPMRVDEKNIKIKLNIFIAIFFLI
tara:strand:- start:9665 stop:9994 length:330 start_codon:yes stop_codon:yes gene_type:complete